MHRRKCSSQGHLPSMQLQMLSYAGIWCSCSQPHQWLMHLWVSLSIHSSFLFQMCFEHFTNRKITNGFLCLHLKYKNSFLFSSFLTKPTLVCDFSRCRVTESFLFRGNRGTERVYWRQCPYVASCFLLSILSLEIMGKQCFSKDFYFQSVYLPEALQYPS